MYFLLCFDVFLQVEMAELIQFAEITLCNHFRNGYVNLKHQMDIQLKKQDFYVE